MKADERRERVCSERSETFRELQRIIKDSGIGLVREEAFERNEFRRFDSHACASDDRQSRDMDRCLRSTSVHNQVRR